MYLPAQECCHANRDVFRFPTTPRSGHEELVGIPTERSVTSAHKTVRYYTVPCLLS